MAAATGFPAAEVGGVFRRAWWGLLLRGLAAIAFGVLTFIWPHKTLLTLVLLYGVYATADGLFSLWAAFRGGGLLPRWWLALAGVISVAAGVAVWIFPGLTAILMAIFIGAWAVVRGIVEIIGAVRMRRVIENEWALALGGLISVVFGVFLMMAPGPGVLALVWAIGAYAIMLGILFVIYAFRVRGLKGALA